MLAMMKAYFWCSASTCRSTCVQQVHVFRCLEQFSCLILTIKSVLKIHFRTHHRVLNWEEQRRVSPPCISLPVHSTEVSPEFQGIVVGVSWEINKT